MSLFTQKCAKNAIFSPFLHFLKVTLYWSWHLFFTQKNTLFFSKKTVHKKTPFFGLKNDTFFQKLFHNFINYSLLWSPVMNFYMKKTLKRVKKMRNFSLFFWRFERGSIPLKFTKNHFFSSWLLLRKKT